jgi:hypothetical protein
VRNDRLTKRQRALISALLEHGTVARASEVAKIPLSTAHRWMQQPEFVAALRASRRVLTDRATTILQISMQVCAVKLHRMAIDESLPPSIQFAACVRVLELGYRSEELSDLQAEVDELKEMLAQLTEANAARARKGLRVAS